MSVERDVQVCEEHHWSSKGSQLQTTFLECQVVCFNLVICITCDGVAPATVHEKRTEVSVSPELKTRYRQSVRLFLLLLDSKGYLLKKRLFQSYFACSQPNVFCILFASHSVADETLKRVSPLWLSVFPIFGVLHKMLCFVLALECVNRTTTEYRGTKSTTKSGLKCKKWSKKLCNDKRASMSGK